jgi:hypothetical protein
MIKIKWSELELNSPIIIQNTNLIDAKVKRILFNNYIYFDAAFDIAGNSRPFELVMPLKLFYEVLNPLPLYIQKQIKNGLCKFKLTKIEKGKAKMELKKVKLKWR